MVKISKSAIVTLLLSVVVALMSFNASAQSASIVKGVVKDDSGQPLTGVTVLVKETSTWTVTDIDGAYQIEASKGNTLEFNYIGFKSASQVWNGGKLDVALQEDNLVLEETVVIGYGAVKKKDLTGSVGVVESEALSTQSTTLLSQRLQGAVPGLVVSRTSSMPGASASIQIRGVTSMSSSEPLILVDGIAVGSIDEVSSQDIDQITVLKDAASASIYGARAAAGVILITTKSAKDGDVTINYNGEVTFNTITELPETVDGITYMNMMNEMKWNDAGNGEFSKNLAYQQDYIDNYLENNNYNPIKYPLQDWESLYLKKYALRHKHSLVLTGGNKVVKTRASVSYENDDALYEGGNYERIMARIRNNINFTKTWSANIDFSFRHSDKDDTQIGGNAIKHAFMYPEIYLGVYPDGRVAEGQSGANTYAAMREGGFKNTQTNLVTGKVSLSYKPVDGLDITASVSPQYTFNKSKDFQKAVPITDPYDPTRVIDYINGYDKTSLTETRVEAFSLETQLVATYSKTFAQNHNFNAMVGYEDYLYRYEKITSGTDQMELQNFPYLDVKNENFLSSSGTAYENAYRSFFGRVMYNYKYRYYVQLNARGDASSRFHRNYRWGFFPSGSVAWVLSNEEWMQDVRPISHLKIRASLGTLGNERIGNYPYQANINFENTVMYNPDGTLSSQMTAAQVDYAVEDITWETTYSWDIGVDANFFDNRLSFVGDFYHKKTKDMLLKLAIPQFTGFANPEQNAGTMYTNGWELKLSWSDKVGDFSYSVGANLSNYKSVMGDLKGTVMDGTQIIREGDEYNAWYGYQALGLFQSAEEVANSALLNPGTKPGDVKFADISGPEGVPDGKITADYDRVILGSSQPKFVYGGYINLGWKGLSLSMTFNGVGKRLVHMSASMYEAFEGSWLAPSANMAANYWSHYKTAEENANARYPRLSTTAGDSNNYEMSSWWLINGAYFRMKNINLGYTFPSKWMKKAKINSLRVYFNVDDPFSIDKMPRGWDPEATNTSYITRAYTIGLDIKF